MPGMTGIELVERTVPLRPHMVRILLTGYADLSTLIEAINSGHVYKYVTKPWNNEDLAVTIARALEHFEAVKSRYTVEMMNQRLRDRLSEISFLAAVDDQLLPEDSSLSKAQESDRPVNFISSN